MAGKTYFVKTAGELYKALDAASGGDRIELAAGNYGELNIRDVNFAKEVTIVSADPEDPAVIESVLVERSANLAFESILFDFVPDQDTLEWDAAIRLTSVSGFRVSDSTFDGGNSVAGVSPDADPSMVGNQGILGYPTGVAVKGIAVTGLVVEGCEVFDFGSGVRLNNASDIVIRDNHMHDLRKTPVAGGDVSDILVEGNHFHDSNPWKMGEISNGLGDHADFIHFWIEKDQTEPSDNIVIRDNLIAQGDGFPIPGILIRSTEDVGYTNTVIEGNIFDIGHTQAISIGAVTGGVIANNTVVSTNENAGSVPRISLGESRNITVIDNLMSAEVDASRARGTVLSDNVIIQNVDPDAANYFGTVFYDSVQQGVPVSQYWVVPGSVAEGAGSPLGTMPATAGQAMVSFQVFTDPSGTSALVFDADHSGLPRDLANNANIAFEWDFGDGTTATGLKVAHLYTEPGDYKVRLQVVGADGKIAIAKSVIAVAGEDLLSFERDDGLFHVQGYGEDTAIGDSDGASVFAKSGAAALDLGDPGVQVSIDREDIQRFFGAESFELSFSLKADTIGSTGEVFRLHNAFSVSVTATGKLAFQFTPAEGKAVTLSSAFSINDGRDHDFTIRLDDAADRLTLEVDGVAAASAKVTSGTVGMGHWDLTFGNPWGQPNFDGTMDAFDLEVDNNDYPFWTAALSTVDEFVFPGNSEGHGNGGGRVAHAVSSDDPRSGAAHFGEGDFADLHHGIPPDDVLLS